MQTESAIAPKALLRDESGLYLLLRRALDSRHWAGEWELPGGKTEPGESFDASLLREIDEETGLKAEIVRFVGGAEYLLPGQGDRPAKRLIFVVMEANVGGKQPAVQVSDEHIDHRWIDARKLKSVLQVGPQLAAIEHWNPIEEELNRTLEQ